MAVRYPQSTQSAALASVQPSISRPVRRISSIVVPGVLMRTVRLLM